jgi:hypothetical protein
MLGVLPYLKKYLIMLRSPAFATAFATVYLVLYIHFILTGASDGVVNILFAFSPFVVVYMAVTIMKYGKYNGAELGENEEWGYQDLYKRK